MSQRVTVVRQGVVLAAYLLPVLGLPRALRADAAVTVNSAVRHQSILGWSVNPWGPWASDFQRDRMLDLAVDELGLTRVRAQEPNGNRATRARWELHNDNADPYDVNWKAFATATADRYVAQWIKPFKQRVEANGERFDLWISPSWFDGGSTGGVPAWLLHSPAEYAEHMLSYLLYLKNTHGIEADYQVVCNEPGNNNAFSPAVVARMIRELGPRMKAAGLKTRIQFPDGVNGASSWRYIRHVGDDPRVWPFVGVLSYHHYGRVDPFRRQMLDLAVARGIVNAQTEHMGGKFARLYDDLTIGGVSFWSIYGWGRVLELGHDGVTVSRGRDYWPLRQVMHYVRPGAVRVGATSSDPTLRVLAFGHHGKTTVVLLNDGRGAKRQTVTVARLPAGRYGTCRSVAHRPYEELGVRTVGDDGRLSVEVVRGAVLTIYPHPGGNLPPVITAAEARPRFFSGPSEAARTVTLRGAATDPEGDRLRLNWQVVDGPGRRVALDSTTARGFERPGIYTLRLAATDGRSTVTKDVKVRVFAGNQPPEIHDLHNRIPVLVTLPQTSTLLRAWPHDLEGDKITSRWSVVRQPAGASVVLEPPPGDRNKLARRATKMDVPGEYVFRFHANDGHAESTRDLTVTVRPPNGAPVIATATVRLKGAGKATLSAGARDPEGDGMTYWWACRSQPAGAGVRITRPGAATCEAAGLTVAGRYVFRVSVVDRTKVSARDVAATVAR